MNERKERGISKKQYRYVFRTYIGSTCITCVSPKALINTAFLGLLPGCTMYLIARVFLIAFFARGDVLKVY